MESAYFKKYFSKVLLVGTVTGILGVLIYFLYTPKFIASTTLYVSRQTASDEIDTFEYEGYYAQQTAISYTSTAIGLLESSALKSAALSKFGTSVNDRTLRELSRRLKVKKTAPQIISISYQSNDPKEAPVIVLLLKNELLTVSRDLNTEGDSKLAIQEVGDVVLTRAFWNVYVNAVVGFGLGVLVSAFGFMLYENLKTLRVE